MQQLEKKFSRFGLAGGQRPVRPYCRDEALGNCKYGEQCRFSHVKPPPTRRDITKEVCTHYALGKCNFGDSCKKQHILEPSETSDDRDHVFIKGSLVKALYDRLEVEPGELPFRKDQILEIIDPHEGNGWLQARPPGSAEPPLRIPGQWFTEVSRPEPEYPVYPSPELKRMVMDFLKDRGFSYASLKVLCAAFHQKKASLQHLAQEYPSDFVLTTVGSEECIAVTTTEDAAVNSLGHVPTLYRVRALFDRPTAEGSGELAFKKDDILEILSGQQLGWISGRHPAAPHIVGLIPEGWVAPLPSNYQNGNGNGNSFAPRPKGPIQCRYFPSPGCKSGEACTFMHGADDRRDLFKLREARKAATAAAAAGRY